MIKKIILKIISYPFWAPFFLNLSLTLHNLSYQLAGVLSPLLESDGLHPKHRLMKYHDWFALRLRADWNVLDIGCGNGALAYDMKSNCRSVTGVDISQKNIDTAQSKFSKKGIRYICADALTHAFEEQFEAIVLSNVLEHIEHRVEFLEKIFENQDKENPPVLLLRVPMIDRDWITLYKKERGVEWRLDSTHYTEYSLEQIQLELKQAGLKIREFDIRFGEFYGVLGKADEEET